MLRELVPNGIDVAIPRHRVDEGKDPGHTFCLPTMDSRRVNVKGGPFKDLHSYILKP
jgi:hypothetical protein